VSIISSRTDAAPLARATLVEHAPAKVNLALHVTGRRADGYHLLDTLVVFTGAGDRVSVCDADTDAFHVEGRFAGGLQGDSDNLVLRARDLLRELGGNASPVFIMLEKNLPIASGIGGGSSDAAATLRALRKLWGLSTDDTRLAQAALSLGADMPMCLAATPLVARGIGEKLEPATGLPPLAMVLVNPGVAVPTPAVFRALANRENPPLPALPARCGFHDFTAWLAPTRNDLQAPAMSVAPVISEVLAALDNSGAALARMSGSGATCFALFGSVSQAERAAASIAAAEPSWYVQATAPIEKAAADVAH
jgi:4-diphosphocytidyl-2-C-methyl-D-erythritol kinase